MSDTDFCVKMSGSESNINTLLSTNANDKPFQDEFNKIFKVLKVYSQAQVSGTNGINQGLKTKRLKGSQSDNYPASVVLADGATMIQADFYKSGGGAFLCGVNYIQNCNSLKEMQQGEQALHIPMTKLYSAVGTITVDVNGFKSPNTWGRDIFKFYVGEDGMLYPFGGLDVAVYDRRESYESLMWSIDDDYQCLTTASSVDGYGCAGRIMEESWKMNY